MRLLVKNNAPNIVAALLAQQADVTLNDVNMNPEASGFLRYAILMGARIHILDQRWVEDQPVSTLRIQHAKQLQAIDIRDEHLHTLVSELPLLYLMATVAKGTSTFPDHPTLRPMMEVMSLRGVSPLVNEGGRVAVTGNPELLPKLRPHLKELLDV